MSEVKPVIKTAEERLREKYPNNTDSDDLLIDYVEWVEFQRQEAAELRAALEASQKELGYAEMAADAEAKFADEYKAKFESQVSVNEQQVKRLAEAIAWIEILRDSFPIELFPTMKTELEAFISEQKGIEV